MRFGVILKLFRVEQYLKNLFIFVPFIFAFEVPNFLAFVAFALFSLLASSVYILNDILDLNEDRKHPTKRFRPIANGDVSLKSAKFLHLFLSFFVLVVTFTLNQKLFFIFLFYYFLNIAYSFYLKHIAIIDLFVIATGFVLRLFVGGVAGGIELSHWIVLMTFLLALFLAFAKRRDDCLLLLSGKKPRKNIDGYNLEFINASMVLMGGVITVSYILYTVSDDVVQKFSTTNLYITSFFVILGILRYMQLTFVKNQSGSPTKVVLKDRFLQIVIIFWFASFMVVVKWS